MKNIHNIYDRIAKKCLSLSSRTSICLINGLFEKDYPLDSQVSYQWTESHDDELHRTLADTILTINGKDSYHLEFQMTEDQDIIFRVMEYGFHHAMKTRLGPDDFFFPEPAIIYLYDKQTFPDEYQLTIHFGDQGSFPYKVPVFKYLQKPLEELEQKKLIALLPFQLLRLRREIEKERTEENMKALQNLITDSIIGCIDRNIQAGNISPTEAMKIFRMIEHLYDHLYGQYRELSEKGVMQMAEDALIFDIDRWEYTIKQQEEALQKQEEELQKQKTELQKKEETIQALKKQEELNQVYRLLLKNVPIEEIARQTGLSEERILEIREQ